MHFRRIFSPNGAAIFSPGLPRSDGGRVAATLGRGAYLTNNSDGVASRRTGRNPVGVRISMAGLPRVDAARQPWASLHIPVGAAMK